MTFMQFLGYIVPTINKHQSFYKKIAEGFTSYLLKRIVSQLAMEGIELEQVLTWKAFSEEEYQAMAEAQTLIDKEI